MTPCTSCGNPTPGEICSRCEAEQNRLATADEMRAKRTAALRRDMTEALTDLPQAYELLPLFTLPGSAPPDPDRRTGTTSPARPPLNLGVLDLMDERDKADAPAIRDDYDLDRRAGARRQGILPNLASWVRLVDGEMWDEDIQHSAPSDRPTVATECAWLLGQIEWILRQQWADELAADLAGMFDDVKAATGWSKSQPERCPKCGWTVEARDDGAWWSCTGCPMTWAREAEISKFVADQDYAKTLRHCAAEVGRPVSSLKEWRARGWITPVATDPRGVQLYDVRKVEEVNGRVVPGRPRKSA